MPDLKDECISEILNAITPFIDRSDFTDVRMKIIIAMNPYSVEKEKTSLTIYEGDINEMMLRRFLMAKAARGLSPRTVSYYRDSVRLTLGKIGKPYNEITADDIRLYMALRVQRDKVSKTTANNERRNLSAFYCWLQNEEILLRNPMKKVEPIKESKKKKKAFSQMELERIRNACRTTMDKALIETLISTWARVSEVSQIKISDLEGNKLIVHGKGDKDREVFLSPKAQLAIEIYMKERSDNNPYLFPRAKYAGDVVQMTKGKRHQNMGEWYKDGNLVGEGHRDHSTIEAQIRRIGKNAGVENTHPHRFRRTGATMALRAGMPLITVSKILGHENIGTTQIYLDISDKELEQAHEKYVN